VFEYLGLLEKGGFAGVFGGFWKSVAAPFLGENGQLVN